jgi:hypothetical protein
LRIRRLAYTATSAVLPKIGHLADGTSLSG